jgi:predicted RNA-binding Zn ribbon-like protein
VITQSAPGETAHPALALANSRRHDSGGAIVDDIGDAPAPMRELREAVRELLLARIEARAPDPGALAAVNAAAAAAPVALRLEWDENPRAESSFVDASALDAARGRIAADAIALVTGPEAADLRACEAPGCVRLLLRDHPRRHWCSTRCGSRVRARRYYARHR